MKKIYILGAIVIVAFLSGGAYFYVTQHNAIPAQGVDGYVVKNSKVYWQEYMQVQWADNKIHQQLNEFEVAGADAATFKTVPFKKGMNLEVDADPQILAAELRIWGKDKANIFSAGQELLPVGSSTPVIDTDTFESLGIFVKDKQAVYEVSGQSYWVLPTIDPASFVVVNREYAKAAHIVYDLVDNGGGYDVVPIPGLDPATFRIIGECGWAETYHSFYAADAHTVVAGIHVVVGADPASFKIIGLVEKNPGGLSIGGSYSVDKNHVYKDCGTVVLGADPAQCTADNLKGCEGKHG